MRTKLLATATCAAIIGLTSVAAPANAATSAQPFSRSITGGSAAGEIRFTSSDTSRYTVEYRIRDAARDGLCIALETTDNSSAYLAWSRVDTHCGAGTSKWGIRSYDKWYNVGAMKVRVCTTYSGRITGCSSPQYVNNPYG